MKHDLGTSTHFISGGINHDPDVYNHPEIFNPEQYLHSEHGTKLGVDESDFRHTLIFDTGKVSFITAIYNSFWHPSAEYMFRHVTCKQ